MDARPVGRVMSVDEAFEFWSRVAEAEKVLGPLSRDERMVILSHFGKEIAPYELNELIANKKVLIIKDKNEKETI